MWKIVVEPDQQQMM